MGSPVPPLPGGSGESIPPPVFPPLHHHQHAEEEPQRGEDYDMLSAWARSLSVSPRLYPTYANESALPSAGVSSSLGLDSPQFGPTTHVGGTHHSMTRSPDLAPVRRESQLTVGTGLSPELGPTRVGSRNSSLGGPSAGGSSSMMASGVGLGGDFSYASAFGAHYADSPPSESLANHHHSPHESARPSAPSPALSNSASQHLPLSFSNLNNLASLSPQLPPAPPPSQPTPITASSLSNLLVSLPPLPPPSTDLGPPPQSSAIPQPQPPASTSGVAATAEEEDPRIRAYAKLEFPTFDIYIQKLSVIIGRRPAAAVLAAAAKVGARSPSAPVSVRAGTPGASGIVGGAVESAIVGDLGGSEKAPSRVGSAAPGEGAVKLEDFVMSMEVDDAPKASAEPERVIKAEPGVEPPPEARSASMVPQLSLTPSSPKPLTSAPSTSVPTPSAPTAAPAAEPTPAPDSFAEFLKSSPHAAPAAPAATSTADSAIPPLSLPPPAPSPAPIASTSAIPAPQIQPLAAPTAPAALPPGFLTDIDLGPIRAVSRQHARLYFDYELGGWAVEVLGRNGVVVDGKWLAKGEKSGMGARTKIQIAERVFFFVLPTIDPPSTINQAASALDALAGSDSELSELDSDLSSSLSSAGGRGRSASRNPLLDGDGDSSSLSELSESDVELSPLQNPHDGEGLPRPTGLKLSLKAPSYDANGHLIAGKRLEMLQAVRSGGKGMGMGSGGKGKGAQRRGGKGKGKMLPPKRPRRDSWAYDSDDDEEDQYSYGGYGGRSYADYEDEVAMMLEKGEVNEDDEEDDLSVAQSPPKRNLELKRAVESKRPNFAHALAMKAPPSTGGKNAGQLASKKRRSDINKIVIKRSDSQPTPPPVAGSSRASKVPAKAPAKMPRRQLDASHTAPDLGLALSDPSLLPPLPPAPPAPLAVLPADGTTALSPANLPPLPLPDLPASAGAPGVPAKRPRARSNATKNGATAAKTKKSPAPPKQKNLPPAVAVNGVAVEPPNAPVLVYGPHTATGQPPAPPRAPPYAPAPMPPGPPPDRAPLDNILAKPPYTYASLIAQAVVASPEEKLTLTGINDWLVERWPYFRDSQPGWQNSVRHNLTLARGFLKVARRADEQGKGSFWTIDPEQRSNFDGHHFRKKATAKTTTPTAGKAPTPAPPAAPAAPAARPAGAPTPSPSLSAPLPIIIAPIPDSYVRPPPPPSNGVPPDELTSALLKDPPIVLHDGRLILNPTIFAHLKTEQLDNLQVLPASQALQILQAHVVKHFKEKMKAMAQEKAAAAAAAAKAEAEAEAVELEEGEIVSTEPIKVNGKAMNGSAGMADNASTSKRDPSAPALPPTGPAAMSKAIPTGPRADRNRPASPGVHRPSSPAAHKPPPRSNAAQPPPSAPKGPRAMMAQQGTLPTGPRAQRVTRQQVASSSSAAAAAAANNKRKLSESTSGGGAAKVVKVDERSR